MEWDLVGWSGIWWDHLVVVDEEAARRGHHNAAVLSQVGVEEGLAGADLRPAIIGR